ncbi:hypothetical protein ES695_18140 [Candidatus Atribacteria bacterium 1244-E10-H5-B2]|nr:MAG: hypothetical protein ES695_18140 [Candidatus Atribacteria bacterium 1244-E10-H5-B2]
MKPDPKLFLQRIREEKYFSNANLLKKQIENDILIAHKMLNNM